jgi:hypothetical protein
MEEASAKSHAIAFVFENLDSISVAFSKDLKYVKNTLFELSEASFNVIASPKPEAPPVIKMFM